MGLDTATALAALLQSNAGLRKVAMQQAGLDEGSTNVLLACFTGGLLSDPWRCKDLYDELIRIDMQAEFGGDADGDGEDQGAANP